MNERCLTLHEVYEKTWDMLSRIPERGTPAADLSDAEKMTLLYAAGAPCSMKLEGTQLKMQTDVRCSIADSGDGRYIVAWLEEKTSD